MSIQDGPGRGLAGSTPEGAAHLVILHGRGVEDLAAARAIWMADLRTGAELARCRPPAPDSAWMPSYLDALRPSVRAEVDDADSGDGAEGYLGVPSHDEVPAPTGPARGEAQVVGEQITGFVRETLAWLADNSPLDEALLALAFRDVAAYLGDVPSRRAACEAVLAGLPPDGECVLVAHSLGSVVALDLLREYRPAHVTSLVTCGSPLGLDAVQRRMPGGPAVPEGIRWTNVWSAADIVTVGAPLTNDWGPGVTDIEIEGRRDDPHAFGTYLSAPEVAHAVVPSLSLAGGCDDLGARSSGTRGHKRS